jgi:hypothetical protein
VTEDAASIAANGLIDSFVLSPDTHKTKVNESFIKVPSIVVD